MTNTPAEITVAPGFLRDERGGGTIFSLVLVMSFVVFGGVSADMQNLVSSRAELQLTADAVAHAAILTRELKTVAESKTAALAISVANLPLADVGEVILEEDIVFGTWNGTTEVFTPDAASRSAVRVVARQDNTNDNPIATFMLWMAGFDQWDVSVTSTFGTYTPTCLRDGFVAQSYVDLQSNNSYFSGFCIHSNDHVELNQGNYFEAGTTVSMPDLSDLEIPASGFDQNDGLEEALVEGSWNIRIIPRISAIVSGVLSTSPTNIYKPSYITANSAVITLTDNKIAAGNLTTGRVHRYTCSMSGNDTTLTINVDVTNVVIHTNCRINFGSNRKLESAVLVTTNTGDKSVQGASGLVIGKVDDCVAGGEVQIVTMGSFYTSAAISIYGSQILAKDNITFSSLGDGSKGASFTAGGFISGTSNMDMSTCGNVTSTNFQANYFNMVR